MAFKPTIPGDDLRLRLNDGNNRHGDRTEFDLTSRPTVGEPTVDEFLPLDSHVPVPFEASDYRRHMRSCLAPSYIEYDMIPGERAVCVYAPDGLPNGQGTHITCRVTLLSRGYHSSEGIMSAHKEQVWQTFNGDPDRKHYSDWVTESFDEQSIEDNKRTVYSCRVPRVLVKDVEETVHKPVIEQAFMIQSVGWGLVEVGAYLTPKPDDGEARELVETVGDRVVAQVSKVDTPEPQLIEYPDCDD